MKNNYLHHLRRGDKNDNIDEMEYEAERKMKRYKGVWKKYI